MFHVLQGPKRRLSKKQKNQFTELAKQSGSNNLERNSENNQQTMLSSKQTNDSVQSQRIAHDQMNNSHSKQLFSFPKQQRFGESKKSYCQTPSYKMESTLNRRSAGLGYGLKSDFTQKDINKPGPDRYSVVSIFEIENAKKKGFTFSLGREEIKFRTIPCTSPTPGPGQYEHDDALKHRKQIYSMGQRTLNPYQITMSKSNPGPATYDFRGISKTGFYFVSKYTGSKATIFSPPTSLRFENLYQDKFVPGPGTYSSEDIRSEGKYFNSKLRSTAGGRFSMQSRISWKTQTKSQNSPGPGQYRVLSEFGDTEFPSIKPNKLSHYKSLSSLTIPKMDSTLQINKQGQNQFEKKKQIQNIYGDIRIQQKK